MTATATSARETPEAVKLARGSLNGTPQPHSIEMEQGVLGSMLISPRDAIAQCVEKINAGYFYLPAHRTIYEVLVELWNAGQAIDLITFTQCLRDRNLLEPVGGAGFITSLYTFVPTAANLAYYLDIVHEKSARRTAIKHAERTIAVAGDESAEFSDEGTAAEIVAVPLVSPAASVPDETKTLLGDRFLCVGGSLLFVGPSGIGKSSASVQQDLCFALGRPAFGMQPARPLRILTIQAENDDGDIGEMARGVCAGLHLSAEDLAAIGDRVRYVNERARTGPQFLAKTVAPLLAMHQPDILRIDPLLAYLGADVNDAEATAAFLRAGLNPLLEKFNCAAIVNHHTPKVTNRDTSGWRTSDWMYAGAGSADVTNWCRAALVIDPTHVPHVFRFIAAKRGGRIGWRNEDGERVYERLFRHDTEGGLFWREATDEDLAAVENTKPGRKGSTKTKADFKALVPMDGAIRKAALFSFAQNNGIGGEKRLSGFLAELIESGEFHEWRIPRPKTNPEIRISRHEQTLV